MNNKVTELDFRAPEFRDAKIEDYERRADGAIVRKDRWENGIRNIANILDFDVRGGFEIETLVERVQSIVSCMHKLDDLRASTLTDAAEYLDKEVHDRSDNHLFRSAVDICCEELRKLSREVME